MQTHRFSSIVVGGLLGLVSGGCAVSPSEDAPTSDSYVSSNALTLAPVAVNKTLNKKVYVHVMPWFESKDSSGNGAWGIHWTMANKNPDVVDGSGKRQIASFYYPLIGPYASGDKDVIEYQLLLMKYAGVDGVLIDWPGTTNALDYQKNVKNAEAIINLTSAVGLSFGIVYEDHNLDLAGVADKVGAAKADMVYLRDHYFSKSNYIKVNGAPLLLDFGPQTLKGESQWSAVFSPLSQKPTFLPLWYQQGDAGSNASGEFAWIYSDFTTGLKNFYDNHPLNVKFGVAYPGFRTFYQNGGWGGPTFEIAPNGLNTFSQTLELAKNSNASAIQVATWNDYGEGTDIEPSREFGYGFLTTMQQKLGVSFGQSELELVNTLFQQRKANVGNSSKQGQLDQAFNYLVSLQVSTAAGILNGSAPPPPPPPPGTDSGTSYYIKSVWKGTFLFDNNTKVSYGASTSDRSYEWALEDKNGFKRLKNVGTGRYMNIEDQLPFVESTSVPDTFYSGYWTIEDAPNATKRLRNAWKGTYVNVEAQNGTAQASDLPASSTSTQWLLVKK